MAGRSVVVRSAEAADAPLLDQLAEGSGAPPDGGQLGRLIAHPAVEVHLAVTAGNGDDDGEEVAGVVVVRRDDAVLPVPARALLVEHLWVVPTWRRRGVGHLLLCAVVAAADAAGVDDVRAAAGPGERGVQRFLARLGFARPQVHRSVALPVLRARLAAASGPGSRDRRRAALTQLVARRRRQLGVSPSTSRSTSPAERSAGGR